MIKKNGQKTIILGWTDTPRGETLLIKDAIKARDFFNCLRAMVIINGKYTKEAQNLARAEQIELWDDKKIIKYLLPVHKKNTVPLNLPGTEDLEKTLIEIGPSLGINSENRDK